MNISAMLHVPGWAMPMILKTMFPKTLGSQA
ncbi:hypothetical protein N826_00425 [Skermanella aerolata KACC 11604]|nr:hypothetical protein N826_00425 [Skermanella aerolata KACC 11604]